MLETLFKKKEATDILDASDKESDVLEFIKKYQNKFKATPTDREIAYEFEFTPSRASHIVTALQNKQLIVCGAVRRTIVVL